MKLNTELEKYSGEYSFIEKIRDSNLIDFFLLMKPRVMSLVIFTVFVGMSLAPGNQHPFFSIITIFTIALGAGSAAVINMWYDRDIDLVMSRTKERPIPSGKIASDDALAFGIILAIFSILILFLVSNFLSAFLLFATIFFYVFIYTIWLKRRTVQNIVIGGASGALPPLIGWTSVTGTLDILPFMMFLIIFLWTPPHFWALSLYRVSDYEKAAIPMLPVIKGKSVTRKHIFIYSLCLFAASFSPSIIGFGGSVYFIGALILGLVFIWMAYLVLMQKLLAEQRLFGYSIFYLFSIFLLMVISNIL